MIEDYKYIFTQRFIFRPLLLSDAEILRFLSMSSHVQSTNINIPEFINIKETQQFIISSNSKFKEEKYFTYGIENKFNSQYFYGCINISSKENKLCEINFWIGESFSNKEIYIEILNNILDICFNILYYEKVSCRRLHNNIYLKKALEECSMDYKGTLINFLLNNNQCRDIDYYEISRNEYLKNKI